jgi:hypothetical protein
MKFDLHQTSNRCFRHTFNRAGTLGPDEVLGGGILLAISISILGISTPQAQMTVDVAKITCRQFLLGHMGGSTRSVANWLSGYYNGKRRSTVIEVGSMQKNVRDLERYCRKNHEMQSWMLPRTRSALRSNGNDARL